METQICSVSFPGLTAIDSARYVNSRGVMPGRGSITVFEEPVNCPRYGALTFSDGVRTRTIANMRVEDISGSFGQSGYTWTIQLSDQRWQWENAVAHGEYNKEDARGNLIPTTVRSPKQLAKILLKALGVTNYTIDLPPGVEEDENGVPNFDPAPGEGLKSTRPETNPYVNWEGIPAREALARLCDQFDRSVVYDDIADVVRIVKNSVGALLPGDHVETTSGNLSLPPIPSGFGVVGAPIRFQHLWLLEAVGDEWDSRLIPINQLSYRPARTPSPQSSQVIIQSGTFDNSASYLVAINEVYISTTGQGSANATATELANLINAHPVLRNNVRATVTSGNVLVITGIRDGQEIAFSVSTSPHIPNGITTGTITSAKKSAWDYSGPPLFCGVQPTDRLSYFQALQFAQGSVFRKYRITTNSLEIDPDQAPEIMSIPGVGKIGRRFSFIFLPGKVEQVQPTARNTDRVTTASGGKAIAETPDFYDGYSRDRRFEVFGAVAKNLSAPVYRINTLSDINTDFSDRVEIPATLDTSSQCVVFQMPVYEYADAGLALKTLPARLVLETSCFIRDAETNDLLRYRRWVKLKEEKDPKTTGKRKKPRVLTRKDNDKDVLKYDHDNRIKWFRHDDVIRSRISSFFMDTRNRTCEFGPTFFDEYDNATAAADKYLDEHISRVVVEGGQTNTYIGVAIIPLDGAIQQVTIEFSEGGMTTIASRLQEHDQYLPSYPTRRIREAIAPNAEAARQNYDVIGREIVESQRETMRQDAARRNEI